MTQNNIVLGAGAAGVSAAYHLAQKGAPAVVYEKNADWGGLCGNFTINGFRFDKFVHFTFPKEKYTEDFFESSSPLYAHPPVSYNYWRGFWLKHPAQTNLFPLPADEKEKIIKDFKERPRKNAAEIKNYGEWLRVRYGNYFAENFPFKYTRKYWGREPEDLETKWVGERMFVPSLKDILDGAKAPNDKNHYYTSFMKYPKKGGFRSILNKAREGLDIRFNKEAVRIDAAEKTVYFNDGTKENYKNIISTLPLPEIVKMPGSAPAAVVRAAENLKCTCGYQISLGFNKPDIAKHLWFYIYDEDILPARVYSPNLKSADNAPAGCGSLQAEVFFGSPSKVKPAGEVLNNTLEKLKAMKIFNDGDLLFSDIRFEKYANVIFDKDIYKNRQTVLDYLDECGIIPAGRFGKWEYMWTHQAFEDGMNAAKRLFKDI